MTFFANAGVSWPSLDDETRKAGAKALNAGSLFWKLISDLENNEDIDQKLKNEVVVELMSASSMYHNISNLVDSDAFVEMLPRDYEEAAIYDITYFDKGFSVREAYRDISQRLKNMAADFGALNLEIDRWQQARFVFRVMQAWERISNLARTISVANHYERHSRKQVR
jgi:hypothetical protein